MKQNIVEIQVPAGLPEAPEEARGGVMYEHNATALRFLLDPVYISPEYRYYLEFVTVNGVNRTDYLTPDEENAIEFSIPAEITSQMTALCCLNIVAVNEAGKTEQLIKSKSVNLYFSVFENTEKKLAGDYAFSVNALLEAIKNGTFKGDKGDKGDSYILTEADKTEIADTVDNAFYGLPLEKREMLAGKGTLPGAAEHAELKSLLVSPQEATLDGITDTLVMFGKNELEWLLRPEQYEQFELQPPSLYASVDITLKPNTEYIFVRTPVGLSETGHSYLTVGENRYWFCHKTQSAVASSYFTFTAPEDGVCQLESTYLYSSEAAYAELLQTDWQGIGIYEKSKCLCFQKSFSDPLYRVNEDYGDTYDFVSGTLTRNTEKLRLTGDMLSEDGPITLPYPDGNAYLYHFSLPASSAGKISDCHDGLCNLLPVISGDLPNADTYAQYAEQTGQREGVWFGGEGIYVISVIEPASLTAYLAENALEVLYAAVLRTQTEALSAQQVLPEREEHYEVSPANLSAEAVYGADLSAVVSDFESRLSKVENRMLQEGII